jgi:hypothetical protein
MDVIIIIPFNFAHGPSDARGDPDSDAGPLESKLRTDHDPVVFVNCPCATPRRGQKLLS